MPASSSGTILKLNVGEGEIAPVDAVLAIIGQMGEAVESPIGEAVPEQVEEPEIAEAAPTAMAATTIRRDSPPGWPNWPADIPAAPPRKSGFRKMSRSKVSGISSTAPPIAWVTS